MKKMQRIRRQEIAQAAKDKINGEIPQGQEALLSLIRFSSTGFKKYKGADAWKALDQPETEGVAWLQVSGIHDLSMLDKLGKHFGLHPLILENILQTGQRPKMEESGEHVVLVAKILSFSLEGEEMLSEQLSLVLGPAFVLSFLEDENPIFQPVAERIEKMQGMIHDQGADFLAYSLLDAVVDSYFDNLELLGDKIEAVEEELVAQPDRETLHLIYHLKREMLFFRKAVWPLREAVINLDRFASDVIHSSTSIYFRDVYDHIAEIIDVVETYRDMLSGMIDIYLSSISNRMNEVMKVLTIIATIFIPLTFLAGLYGMNFKYMPELSWRWGYPMVLGIMATSAAGMLVYFRKRHWF